MTVRFISDTHFNHANILKPEYCNRPFKDVNHMNEAMVKAWNSIVRPEDTVFHLGDVAMGKKENVPKFVSRLLGRKILILGNHDRSKQFMLDSGFDEVYKTLVYCHSTPTESYDILLTHHPLLEMNELIPKGLGPSIKLRFAFHGHTHGDIGKRNGLCYDVGVDSIGYVPKTVEEIIGNDS